MLSLSFIEVSPPAAQWRTWMRELYLPGVFPDAGTGRSSAVRARRLHVEAGCPHPGHRWKVALDDLSLLNPADGS